MSYHFHMSQDIIILLISLPLINVKTVLSSLLYSGLGWSMGLCLCNTALECNTLSSVKNGKDGPHVSMNSGNNSHCWVVCAPIIIPRAVYTFTHLILKAIQNKYHYWDSEKKNNMAKITQGEPARAELARVGFTLPNWYTNRCHLSFIPWVRVQEIISEHLSPTHTVILLPPSHAARSSFPTSSPFTDPRKFTAPGNLPQNNMANVMEMCGVTFATLSLKKKPP